MINKHEIASQISFISSLSLIVEAFEEIAVSRIQRVRTAVLYKRDFLSGLSGIFADVTSSYRDEIIALMRKKKIAKRPEKRVFVFLSSNTGLYGDIVQETFTLFLERLKKEPAGCDIVIIGKLGRILFQRKMPKTPFTYFDFSDSSIEKKQLRDITIYLLRYEDVSIFYGEFRSIVSQVPTVSTIAGSQLPDKAESTMRRKYFFEPTLGVLVKFFEDEIFASLFEQRLHENHLAKFAARIVTLDNSREHIEQRLKGLAFEEQKLRHRLMNKKQQMLLSGMSLWR